MTCNNVNEVYSFYVNKAVALAEQFKGKNVLKTDCHNESGIYSHSIPIIPRIKDLVNVTALEIDEAVINKAKINIGVDGWKVVQGDIRQLPFSDNEFDLLMDFSTIDHVDISKLPMVFSEYRRVCKTHSHFFIVVWTSNVSRNAGEGQYYFERSTFEEEMMLWATVEDAGSLWVHPNNKNDVLRYYYGRWN
jgi:SAM-dependent methyltransferase